MLCKIATENFKISEARGSKQDEILGYFLDDWAIFLPNHLVTLTVK